MASQLETASVPTTIATSRPLWGSAASISHRGRACEPFAGRETGTVVRLDAAKLALTLAHSAIRDCEESASQAAKSLSLAFVLKLLEALREHGAVLGEAPDGELLGLVICQPEVVL